MAKASVSRILKVVELRWIDSTAINEWSEIADLTHEHDEIVTVGMLIHQDRDTYLIASTYDSEQDSINAAIWIPAACVRKVRVIGTVAIKTD